MLILVRYKLTFLQANCGDPNQTLLIAASALGLYCFPTSKKMDSWLILVRYKLIFLQANYGDPNQTPLIAASALGLHCFSTSKNLTLGLY